MKVTDPEILYFRSLRLSDLVRVVVTPQSTQLSLVKPPLPVWEYDEAVVPAKCVSLGHFSG